MSVTIGAIAAARRPKWQYPPPPPTPRILHLPRRPRRKVNKNFPGKPASNFSGKSTIPSSRKDRKGKLHTLFDQEGAFAPASVPIVVLGNDSCGDEGRRERVEERESEVMVCGGGGGDRKMAALEEEKWRFQAEMLRAECNLLRMEKEIAVKKLERTRVKLERTLKSAVHSLVSVSSSSLISLFYSFVSRENGRSFSSLRKPNSELNMNRLVV